jgi:predicted amino acid racemase
MIKEDNSMKEIHKIMENLSAKRAVMSAEDVVREINEGAEKTRKKHNVKLRAVERHGRKLTVK